jgi:ubiquinone/menaquinone biosynthesis C-methylase UbiE
MNTNTTRFSDRVADYINYRPHYPVEFLDILSREIQFNPSKIIADIGSGTGISSELFIENKNQVYAVEPNLEMQEAAEVIFKTNPNFIGINGTAETSNLESNSIDLILCAQAFHWFDKDKSKQDFNRILKSNGHICFIWNERSTKSDFQQNYEQILYDTIDEYNQVNHRNIDKDSIQDFFSPLPMREFTLSNYQLFDLVGLKGRLMSSSYCPKSGEEHTRLMDQLNLLFLSLKSMEK